MTNEHEPQYLDILSKFTCVFVWHTNGHKNVQVHEFYVSEKCQLQIYDTY